MSTLTPDREKVILEQMNERFEALKVLAENKGYTVNLHDCNIVERDGKAREWSTLNFEPYNYDEGYLTVRLNSLDDLENLLLKDLKPKFKRGQAIYWSASFVATGKFKQNVRGKVENVSFDPQIGFLYYCRTNYRPAIYTAMTSSKEGWFDEDLLKESSSAIW